MVGKDISNQKETAAQFFGGEFRQFETIQELAARLGAVHSEPPRAPARLERFQTRHAAAHFGRSRQGSGDKCWCSGPAVGLGLRSGDARRCQGWSSPELGGRSLVFLSNGHFWTSGPGFGNFQWSPGAFRGNLTLAFVWVRITVECPKSGGLPRCVPTGHGQEQR